MNKFIIFVIIILSISCTKHDEFSPFIICGHVKDEETNENIAGAYIELFTCHSDPNLELDYYTKFTESDSTGKFRIVDNGCENRGFKLIIEAENYKTDTIMNVDGTSFIWEECKEIIIELQKNKPN